MSRFRHDLRTPLNHIVGYGEMLAESAGEEGRPGLDPLRKIIAAARELASAIQNFPDETLACDARKAIAAANLAKAIEDLLPLFGREDAGDVEKMLHAARQLSTLADGAADEPEPPAAEQSPSPQSDGGILVVDDDPGNRELLRRMLERQSYTVTAAASGPECLDLMSNRRFDLVLLDVMMPGMSGFEVLSRIRESAELRAVPVIVISALDESSAAIRCIQMGAEDYLPKPFDPVLLKARIGATLEKKRLRDQEARYARDLEVALAELHGAKDKLVVQEKLASLGALTAGIAHELKNPLNFITNFASLARENATELAQELAKPVRDPGEIAEILELLEANLERVESHGKRADRIVRGMLLHSRAQPGKRERVDLNALVEEALSLAFHFNVLTRKNLSPSLPPIPAVPQDISRVLVNILNNASYSIEEKKRSAGPDYEPRILLETIDAGDMAEIVIEDNGNGMAPETARKIFDPFFTTKPAGDGTGLGLSISYDVIVRAHSGTIAVESEPGRFARFRIRLPKTERRANAA